VLFQWRSCAEKTNLAGQLMLKDVDVQIFQKQKSSVQVGVDKKHSEFLQYHLGIPQKSGEQGVEKL
jgi:hypothetical protein